MTVQIAANSTKLKEKAVSKVDLSSNWPGKDCVMLSAGLQTVDDHLQLTRIEDY